MNTTAILFALALIAATSCSKGVGPDCIDPAKINPDGICTHEYDPVCGCDGKTYGNACSAANAGVLSTSHGECD